MKFKILCIYIITSLFFISCIIPKMNLNASIADKVNNNTAIPVDIIFIFDEKLIDEFKKMPAANWFIKKEQYINDYALNDKIQILTFEFVPGQQFFLQEFEPNYKPINTIIFANYANTNENRIIIQNYKSIHLNLNDTSFVLMKEN